jgi:hypothetical protein
MPVTANLLLPLSNTQKRDRAFESLERESPIPMLTMEGTPAIYLLSLPKRNSSPAASALRVTSVLASCQSKDMPSSPRADVAGQA